MKIASADIESNEWIKLVAIGFYDGENYEVFKDVKEFLDFVIKKKYNRYRIYFHNGGRYDFLFLIQELLDRGQVNFVEAGSKILLMKFRYKDISIEFADSYFLLPSSLEKLINIYEIEDKKIELDFTKKFTFTNKIMQAHLKNDCLALYKILRKVEYEEGYLSLTIASHSMRTFRENFLGNLKIWNVSDNMDNYFRTNYYRGGRVEVFKGCGKNLFYYDFNSLYPSVMLEKMPLKTPILTNKYKRDKIGFYKIKLKTDTNELISILCYKNKSGNYYVNGDNGDVFYLCSKELEYLDSIGYKFDVISGFYFDNSEHLFVDYVNYFYDKKVNAKSETERYFAKLKLNTLYGKFGQRLKGEEIVVNDGKIKNGKVFDSHNDLIIVDKQFRVKFKGVYIASYITALARVKHLLKMREIGFENIYYCDTDSIVTNKKIEVSNKIGELKLEYEIKEGVFLMPKSYGIKMNDGKEILHYKGFSSKEFSFEQLKDLLNNNIKKLVQYSESILGFREVVKRKFGLKSKIGNFLATAKKEKKLEMNYTRREIIKDKKYSFITKCFRLKDLLKKD